MALPPAVPFCTLGGFLTAGAALFIAGCSITKNWYPLLTLIPATLTVFCLYMFHQTSDNDYEGGFVSSDTWFFGVTAGMTSMLAMPLMFKHIGLLDGVGLGMHLAGDAMVAIGYGVFMLLRKKEQEEYGWMQ